MTATPGTAVLVVGGGPAGLAARARRRGIPLTLTYLPPDYSWPAEFLLVRPDQHIAWRAADPAGLDIETAVGLRPVRAGISGI